MKASMLGGFVLLIFMYFQSESILASGPMKLFLKSGKIELKEQDPVIISQNLGTDFPTYQIVTFKQLPNHLEKSLMKEKGMELFQYLPDHSFYAKISQSLPPSLFIEFQIFSLTSITAEMKIHPLLKDAFPEWCLEGEDRVSLILNTYETPEKGFQEDLTESDIDIKSVDLVSNRIFISAPIDQLLNIAAIQTTYFIEPVDPPSFPENYFGRVQHRSNHLAQEFKGGKQYDGRGITLGMHDDGLIGPHIDYQGRIPRTFVSLNYGNHGDHVAGTIMGAGNLNPLGRGMASGADLYVYDSSNDNFDSVPSHYNKYQIVILSKSYSNGCNAGYTSLSQKLDQQARLHPSLLHIFSAGNMGTSDCSYGAGSGWGNVTGGHKIGKNVIATGNLDAQDVLRTSSSRGPASDGRIKPDICAKGTNVYSTIDQNDYSYKTGTSMACPGISGSVAQLYNAFEELNFQQSPPSNLIKGVLLNSADDIGNPGPDFKTGWGRINLRRALEILENNQYIGAQISTGNNLHTINIPADIAQLKVMVYWHDFESTPSASKALVNNLDMTITDGNQTYFPLVLNPDPNPITLDSIAKPGIDSLNNMEQIVIDQPLPGNYTLNIAATSVPSGPQSYYVIYEFIYDEIVVIYPNGGEGLVSAEVENVFWDAHGNSGSFDLEYSSDNGIQWTTVASAISGSERQFNWVVDKKTTEQGKFRISRGILSDESDAQFNIIDAPDNLRIRWICEDSLKMTWNAKNGAVSYRTYQLGNKYMDSVGTTDTASFVYHNIDTTKRYWLSVSSNPGVSSTGRRAIAIQSKLGTDNCPVKNTDGIVEIDNDEHIKVFPNPTDFILNVEYPPLFVGNITFEFRDLSGKLAYSLKSQANDLNLEAINVEEFNRGTYILMTHNKDKSYAVQVSIE